MEPYMRMVKMGVPTDSAAQKMRLSGVFTEADIANFTKLAALKPAAAKEKPLPAVNPLAAMLSARQQPAAPAPAQASTPEGAGAKTPLKAEAKTAEAAAVASPAFSGPAPTKEECQADPVLAKFCKMCKMGVPPEGVAGKMKGDGVEHAKVVMFLRAYAPDSSLLSPPPAAKPEYSDEEEDEEEEPPVPVVDKAMLKADPVLGKFAKMCAMGVPAAAALGKMTAEGVPVDQIAIFAVAHGMDPPGRRKSPKKKSGGRRAPPGAPPSAALAAAANRRTSVPMQTIHWDAIPQEKLQNSVWASANKIDEIDDNEIKQLESLFSAAPAKSVAPKGGTKGGKAKIAPPSVLDGKRANNMAIALAQFKNFYKPLAGTSTEGAPAPTGTDGEAHDAWKDLCVAVLRQDVSDLNPDKVPL